MVHRLNRSSTSSCQRIYRIEWHVTFSLQNARERPSPPRRRKYVDIVSPDTELAPVEVHVVPFILTLDELVDEGLTSHWLPLSREMSMP